MKLWCKQILLLAIGLCGTIIMPAQTLPVLPADPAVRTGVLPNGTSYYVVSNPTVKGLADFALVQKTGTSNIQDPSASRAVSVAQGSLGALQRCLAPTLQSYVTSHGSLPGPDGFVRVSDNSTLFHFRDVVLDRPSTVDSTLLVLMSVIDKVTCTDDPFVRKWYSPSDQAVVVSGDIKADDVISKLAVLSMMTPAGESQPRDGYVWQPCDTASFVRVGSASSRLGRLSASWRSPRTPESYMNTVQPAIFELFLAELSMLTEEHIRAELKKRDIPAADVSCSYVVSSQTSSDEVFTVNVVVDEKDFTDAVSAVSSVLACIDEGHAPLDDVLRIKRICTDEMKELSGKPIRNNSEYVDKCVTSFLYGSSLATSRSKVDFLSSREIADATELGIFNDISSALLDPEKNLTVRYSAPMPEDSVRAVFSGAWNCQGDTLAPRRYTAADIPVFVPSGNKMKVKSDKPDHMSKGYVWTFSNGFTVVYRKMDTKGMMFYNLARNGGFGSIPDLEKGEGGYVGDYFFLSRIAGMDAEDFLDVLNSEGISMDAYVGLTNMMISGYAPDDKLGLLMRALIAVVNDRVPEEHSSGYYARSEALRQELRKGTREEGKVAIDSIMCPDYRYSSYKTLDAVPEDLMAKADRYFRSQSEKMNDGVLILLGDKDEAVVKKQLLSYVEGFKTTDKAFRRPVFRYQPASGWSTYTVEGNANSIDVAMSAPMILSSDNVLASEIAVMVLRKYLSEALDGTGLHVSVVHDCKIYPQERLNMLVTLNEASVEGFASGVEHPQPLEALQLLRSALSSLPDMKLAQEDLAAFKSQLKGRIALEMKDPFYWLNVISRRYLAGKDFTSGYEQKIDAVTAEKVRELLVSLDRGSKVEYVISK